MFAPLSLEYNASYLLPTCFTADDTDERLDWGCTVNNGTTQCPKVEEKPAPDRKSVVQGKSVDLGGRRIIKKKTNNKLYS